MSMLQGLLGVIDPRTPDGFAISQALPGLLGGSGSSMQRFAGANAVIGQTMERERARKLLEDRERQMMAEREQMMQARAMQQKQAQEQAARAQQDEAIARRLFGQQQQMGMPGAEMGPAMPERTGGMINPQTFLAQGGSLGGLGGVAGLNQMLQAPERKPIISKRGDIARDPVTNAIVWQNEDAPEKDDADIRLLKMLHGEGTPAFMAALAKLENKRTTHAPAASATVVMPAQEKEENKAVGKYFGEQYGEVQKSGLAAGGTIARLTQMQNLMQGVNTGKLTATGMEIAGIAQALGVNIDPKLGQKQALDAVAKEMTLQLRNPSGGAGMPGAMSDADRNFLQAASAGVDKTPEGNRLIIEARIKLAKRDQEVAQMARNYRARNGTIDEGFYNELAAFAEANPMFNNVQAAPAGGAWSITKVK